ncbi:MAG: hypothetical protein HC869_18590 [Rhodospirillales bacterium]|nr:hypothetical protein [Rhodospirillales bacterium]
MLAHVLTARNAGHERSAARARRPTLVQHHRHQAIDAVEARGIGSLDPGFGQVLPDDERVLANVIGVAMENTISARIVAKTSHRQSALQRDVDPAGFVPPRRCKEDVALREQSAARKLRLEFAP